MDAASLTVGFLGTGFMTQVHSRGARLAGARIAGVVGSSPAKGAAAARELRLGRGYDSVAELVSDPEIDLVHVCTPNALHAEQVRAVLAAGKHVICEKPLGVTGDEAAGLLAAAGDAVTGVPFVYRFHPLVREARARVRAGDIGTVLHVNGVYLQDWMLDPANHNWRADGDAGGPSRAFADIGSHLCDLVEFVTGDRIARVCAVKSTVYAQRGGHVVDNEDAGALLVTTTGGAIGTLLVSQVAPGRKNGLVIEIAGSAESIRFDQEQPETIWLGRATGSVLLPRDPDQLGPDAQRLSIIPAGHPQGYQDAFNAFIADTYAAVGGETSDGLPTFADGARAARLTDAFLAATDQAGWVDVVDS
ncbi:Gfo/Idh/MocA family protein [Microlunatus sp. Y2014]|uniref:Gfo/Idh/MocA family protein n=1 Tax=Microlunatus sp. Y2014 TaxID=3418488 RepID=UPI003DA6DA47